MTQIPLLEAPAPALPQGIDLRCMNFLDLVPDIQGARLVFADPPWSYSNSGDKTRSAASHYSCLPMAEIVDHLRIAHDYTAADDAYLVLWATFPLLSEWMSVATEGAIGWRYVTGGAWAKTGAPGAGFHWRGNAEPVLIYRRGKPKPTSTRLLRSVHVSEQHRWRGDRRYGEALSHSEKPIGWQANMIDVWSSPGDLVLDVYAGLGTVARACLKSGRRYAGAEIDPDRHRQAIDRIALYRP
jgi:hypothetical protein